MTATAGSSNPTLNHDGRYVEHRGYITDIMNELAVDFLERKRAKPFSLFFAHKAVHPDAHRPRTARSASPPTAATSPPSAIAISTATRCSRRRRTCCRPPRWSARSPPGPNASASRSSDRARAILAALHAGEQEEIRQRARMMASVDEGHRRDPRSAGAAGQARRYVHRFSRRQRLFLRRARARPRAPLRATRKASGRRSSSVIRAR